MQRLYKSTITLR